MSDFTTGPITRHLMKTSSFMLVTMVFQTLYFLIDLYWVGRLGTQAVAAVGIAGNVSFLVIALTQVLGVGTTAVISHAAGRKDRPAVLLLFNQAQALSVLAGVAFLVVAMLLRVAYVRAMAADEATARLAGDYLLWFIPAMGLQFLLVAMGSALRAVGNFRPGMLVSSATILLNTILAPFLIFGWGTGHAFGVAGAAMSSLIAILVGIAWFFTYFVGERAILTFHPEQWRPQLAHWKRMLAIGLPAGFEFAMTALYMAFVYTVSKPFGAAAQAGFGVGMRIIQAGFMPVLAMGFSVAPVAGQNFGAGLADRVKRTFYDAAGIAVAVMLVFAVICQLFAAPMAGVFAKDPAAVDAAVGYLRIVSWGFIASGVIFVASSTFQAMGNTMPSLVSSGVRTVLAIVPVLLLSTSARFDLHWIWYASLVATAVQLALSLGLLRREFERRLPRAAPASVAGSGLAGA